VIPKGHREEVRVQLTEFKGSQFADFRVWSEFAGASGARSATKQGLTVSFERLPAFAKAVAEAESRARALGLIGGAD
jgi:hypothetical protein